MINDELLHKWINNTISEKELQIFKARPEYDSLVSLYQHTEDFAAPEVDTEKMLHSILQSENKQEEVKSKVSKFPLWSSIAIAASIVLIAAYFLFNNSITTFENTSNQQLAESLPNGSKVTLFANSKIDFDESEWANERTINLSGKAFFDVVSGKTFTVNSQKGKVEVMGTQFLVDNKEESFEVNCFEGKVKVSSNTTGANAILSKNESFVIFDDGASILRQQKTTKVKKLSLELICKEIESVFEASLNKTNVDMSQKLTTGFQHNNLENAIKTVCLALKLDYEIQGKSITLKNK